MSRELRDENGRLYAGYKYPGYEPEKLIEEKEYRALQPVTPPRIVEREAVEQERRVVEDWIVVEPLAPAPVTVRVADPVGQLRAAQVAGRAGAAAPVAGSRELMDEGGRLYAGYGEAYVGYDPEALIAEGEYRALQEVTPERIKLREEIEASIRARAGERITTEYPSGIEITTLPEYVIPPEPVAEVPLIEGLDLRADTAVKRLLLMAVLAGIVKSLAGRG